MPNNWIIVPVFLIIFFVLLFLPTSCSVKITISDNEVNPPSKKTDCEYLGTSPDIAGVAFYKCDGEIKLKPMSELK